MTSLDAKLISARNESLQLAFDQQQNELIAEQPNSEGDNSILSQTQVAENPELDESPPTKKRR